MKDRHHKQKETFKHKVQYSCTVNMENHVHSTLARKSHMREPYSKYEKQTCTLRALVATVELIIQGTSEIRLPR